MPNTRKLVDLTIEETSGVDHPAHLHEGWLVRKNETAVLDQALADLDDQPEPDQGTKMDLEAEVTIDAPADDVVVADAEPAIEPVELAKADDQAELVTKELADLRKQLDDATAEAAALREEREMEKATERVAAWRILPGVVVSEFAPVLRALRAASPEATATVETIFDGCAEALAEAGVLKELGTDMDDTSTEAWDQIQGLAKSAVEGGRASSVPEAIGLVASENPDLYARYRQEQGV
tara:strand:+ start:133 stop:846 length:714 start_codon:yes stop_codon:yes gene_type:complete